MTKTDTFRARGDHLGDLGYQSKFFSAHQYFPGSHRAWKAHVRSNIEQINKSSKNNIQASFETNRNNFSRKNKTQIEAIHDIYPSTHPKIHFLLTNQFKFWDWTKTTMIFTNYQTSSFLSLPILSR